MTLYVEQQRGSAAKCAAFELGVPLVSPLASPLCGGAVWRKIHQRPRLGRMGPVWQFDSRRSARSATASLPGAQDHSVSSQDDTLQASREEAANRAPKADDPSAPCCSRPHGRCLPHPLRCFVPSAGAEA